MPGRGLDFLDARTGASESSSEVMMGSSSGLSSIDRECRGPKSELTKLERREIVGESGRFNGERSVLGGVDESIALEENMFKDMLSSTSSSADGDERRICVLSSGRTVLRFLCRRGNHEYPAAVHQTDREK